VASPRVVERLDECLRCGTRWRPASSSTLRTEVAKIENAETLELADDPFVSPVRILPRETKDQFAERALEPRTPGPPLRVRPPARDQLPVPAKQRLRPEREGRPARPRERAAQGRQQRSIRPRERRPRGLSAEDRQLMAKDEDLQLVPATRPPQQPHQREQVPDNEIHNRPEQVQPPRSRQERRTSRGQQLQEPRRVCEPYGLPHQRLPRVDRRGNACHPPFQRAVFDEGVDRRSVRGLTSTAARLSTRPENLSQKSSSSHPASRLKGHR